MNKNNRPQYISSPSWRNGGKNIAMLTLAALLIFGTFVAVLFVGLPQQ
jgi:hypothetical protein